MKIDNDTLINKFLEKDLTQEEVKIFKTRYADDPDFKKEVNLQSKIYISLRSIAKYAKMEMAVAEEEKDTVTLPAFTSNLLKYKNIYRYAAIGLAVVSIGTILFFTNLPTGYNKLLKAELEVAGKENVTALSGQVNNFIYIQRDIDNSVIESLDELGSVDAVFEFGIFCMDQKQFNQAIVAFKRVISFEDTKYSEKSEWYLGLCYLKIGNEIKAKEVLSNIANNSHHPYLDEAKKLLKKLN